MYCGQATRRTVHGRRHAFALPPGLLANNPRHKKDRVVAPRTTRRRRKEQAYLLRVISPRMDKPIMMKKTLPSSQLSHFLPG